jgi:hypothetical protein
MNDIPLRIDLQDRVRRVVAQPRDEDLRTIEQLRQLLLTQFSVLTDLQSRITGQTFVLADQPVVDNHPSAFEDLDDEGSSADQGMALSEITSDTREFSESVAGGPPHEPETRPLGMPSTWVNQDNPYSAVELNLRIQQADKCLQALQDNIADKSFQYSHVIRVAPRKGVRTRGRGAITKLNGIIAYHARVYERCRRAMSMLGANEEILTKYPILLKEHLKSSTALLNPNEPGSTRLKLSWIWRPAAGLMGNSSESLLECGSESSETSPCCIPDLSHSHQGTLDTCPRPEKSMERRIHIDWI